MSLDIDSGFFYSNNNSDIVVPMELQFAYTFLEIIVAIIAVIGNGMVILVFRQEKRLRRRTNYYIVSLAVADLLVGLLGIPFAILASIGLPSNLHACLFTVSLLVVLCTISIFCLVAVSVDRYWAILHPMDYSRNVRTKTTIVIISLCWMAGAVVGFLPLFGWHADVSEQVSCFFVKVMDYNFLVFLYFVTIITPSLAMAAFYAHIYTVVVRQLKQIVTMNPKGTSSKKKFNKTSSKKEKKLSDISSEGTMLRVLGAAQKREVKATQNLSVIVLFFIICWIPLYTINCIKAFCPGCHIAATLTDFCIILSHLNSAVNPILYAYHLRDFRAALKTLIFKLFNLKESTPTENYYKPSVISHTNRNTEKRYSNHNTKIYIDSPVWVRQQQELSCSESEKSIPTTTKREPPEKSNDMWMISEVSSASEREICHNSVAIISQSKDANYYSDDELYTSCVDKSSTYYDFVSEDQFKEERVSTYEINSIYKEDRRNDVENTESDRNEGYLSNTTTIYCVETNDTSNDLRRCDKHEDMSTILFPKADNSFNSIRRLSPLKFFSDFIINQSSNNFIGSDNYYNLHRHRNPMNCGSSDVFQYLDLHKHCTNCSKNSYNVNNINNR